ncbi:DNA recombination protein RmuC [Devosia enhydra]|uniref:DNA recombination protein RmuC homolog n=1 Tax=Devosia enhydra TaxID=665118 RepID=A0A1K2I1Z1_9HYPH|nr:DNA recombination protein RmuC [Devosia enhydra]SFZ86410.1 DNA recombination protein RmuC [Devosia enhydra]
MDTVLLDFGSGPVTLAMALPALVGAAGLLLLVMLIMHLREARRRAAATEDTGRALEDLMRAQAEMTGRMQTMAEIFGTRTSDLARLVNERLDSHGHRLGEAMRQTTARTEDSLGKLGERLAVIDRAQATITQLSGEVVSLQQILANKQTRGAFGQGRMEAIIADALPMGAYSFQPTLSNGSRPDCMIGLPNGAPGLVVDAKFPLESWQRFHAAEDEGERQKAAAGLRADMNVHVRAIAEKYLIAGETHDLAFLFVPSEAIFADLNEQFEDVVQRAARARVVIVSPALLLLCVQVVQALLRDVRMREQAHLIQAEVQELLADLGRLDDRVQKLRSHFGQAQADIDQVLVSTRKLAKRGTRIETLDFSGEDSA